MATQRQGDAAAVHVLPRWFETLQDTVFLSALIAAEMFVNGLMMTYGIVGDIENPLTWGVFGLIGVVVMFAAGMLMGGMSVRCSSALFLAAKEHDWGFALANLIGLFLFGMPEIWASLVERSTHLQANAPDRLAMQEFGATNWAVTPTTLFISIALPLAAAYWGISSRKAPAKSMEDIEADRARKLAEQRARNELSALKAAGKRRTEQAYDDPDSVLASPGNDDVNTGGLHAVHTGDSDADTSRIDTARRRNTPGTKAVPSDMMSTAQFRAYLAENDVHIPADKAVGIVQSAKGCIPVGKTFAAPRRALIPVAMRMIERARSTANAGDQAQEVGA